MLSQSKLQSIIWTSRLAEAEAFSRDVFWLRLKGKSDIRCGRLTRRWGHPSGS